MRFRDREQAGDQLGERLRDLNLEDAVVLALPRGGVPVGARVARILGVPFDVFVARKLVAPRRAGFGIGAVAEGDAQWIDRETVASEGIGDEDIMNAVDAEQATVRGQVRMYRNGRLLPDLRHRPVILVDDGIATSATIRAAIEGLRLQGADHIVLAVPVAPPSILNRLAPKVEEIVCLSMPEGMWAIGSWYDDFEPVADSDVILHLDLAHDELKPRPVLIPTRGATLEGMLTVPLNAKGIVVFAHGGQSSRFSFRNRFVARQLSEAGIGTLLFDLLTINEYALDLLDQSLLFNIDLLTNRLVDAMDWLGANVRPQGRRLGLFGAGTGAAAAFAAAEKRPAVVEAVLSRGGRPDLARSSLPNVEAPVLLVVGGNDREILALNRQSIPAMRRAPQMEVIEGAGHLFAEPGGLERVAQLARHFFVQHLGTDPDLNAPTLGRV